MTAANYTTTLSLKLKQTRLRACSTSIWAFAKNYLGNHFELKPSKMHIEISDMLQQISNDRYKKLAITGPYQYRQCELISLAYTLWSICFKKEHFILLVTDNHEQAKDIMLLIKHEIINNKLIKTDFVSASGKNPGNWNSLSIITRNGIKIRATGFNKRHLNFRHQNTPPSLIILNLPDDHEMTCYKKDQTAWRKWFDTQIERNTTPKTNIIAAGTFAPNPDSLLKDIFSHNNYKDWTTKSYSSIITESINIHLWKRWEKIHNAFAEYYYQSGPEAARHFFKDNKEEMLAGKEVLWPEYEDYYHLMQHRNSMSSEKFYHLKMNLIYRTFTRTEQFIINFATDIASNYGITLQIPYSAEKLGINGLLEANGILNFDLNEVLSQLLAQKNA